MCVARVCLGNYVVRALSKSMCWYVFIVCLFRTFFWCLKWVVLRAPGVFWVISFIFSFFFGYIIVDIQ